MATRLQHIHGWGTELGYDREARFHLILNSIDQ